MTETVKVIVHERKRYETWDVDCVGVQWPDSNWLHRYPATGVLDRQPGDEVAMTLEQMRLIRARTERAS